MQLIPSLHQIGSDIVNVYLVEEAGEVTVVDAGLPGQWKELVAELARMGRTIDDVRAVVLTHGDTDHIGLAGRLHREHGVPIHIHEADAARARAEVRKRMTGWGPVRIGPFVRFMVYSGRRGGLRIPAVGELATFGDVATLDVPGSPLIVRLPGHTPGSVAYHIPAMDAVFVGDALTTRSVLTGETGPRPAPFTLDPEGASRSIDVLETVGARWVLPGHGPAWSGGVVEAARLYRAAAAPSAAPDRPRGDLTASRH